MADRARLRALADALVRAPRESLRFRLALIFAAGAMLVAVALSGYQFLAYRHEIRMRNRRALEERVQEVAAIVRSGNARALEDEVVGEGSPDPDLPVWVRVQGGGAATVETPGMDRRVPGEVFAGRSRVRIHHHLFLLMDVEAGGRRVLGAMDVSEVERTIRAYQHRLIVSLLAGATLCALFGAWAAHRGLQPLRDIAASTRTITARRLRERLEPGRVPRELRDLVQALNDLLDRLDRAFTRLSQFSGDLAHELRTPINNLMGEAEVTLGRDRSPEEYRQALESSLEEYRRLSGLITRMLFLARAEDPGSTLEARDLDAAELLSGVRAFFEADAEEREVRLVTEGTGRLRGDPDLIRQALANLVANALKATPAGGEVRLAFRSEPGAALLAVEDTGRGIPAAELPHLFDRFARTRESRERREEGMGLGLAIVQSIVALHRGEVDVRSDPGRGTRVSIRIPG